MIIEFRCKKCNKLLARYSQAQDLEIKCTRCGTQNHILEADLPARYAILNINSSQYFIPLKRYKNIPASASRE